MTRKKTRTTEEKATPIWRWRLEGRSPNSDLPIRNPDEIKSPPTYVSRTLVRGKEVPLAPFVRHPDPLDSLRKRRILKGIPRPREKPRSAFEEETDILVDAFGKKKEKSR